MNLKKLERDLIDARYSKTNVVSNDQVMELIREIERLRGAEKRFQNIIHNLGNAMFMSDSRPSLMIAHREDGVFKEYRHVVGDELNTWLTEYSKD